MRTSFARGGATSTSSSLRGSPAAQQTAALHLMVFPAVSDMAGGGWERSGGPADCARADIGSEIGCISSSVARVLSDFIALTLHESLATVSHRRTGRYLQLTRPMSFTNLYYKRVGITLHRPADSADQSRRCRR